MRWNRYRIRPPTRPCAKALPKLKGFLSIGVINSIRRRIPNAIEPLGALIHDEDTTVAGAAALAAGEISGPVAAKMLLRALGTTKGAVRTDAAGGALLCADRMMAEDREGALSMLDALSRPTSPTACGYRRCTSR